MRLNPKILIGAAIAILIAIVAVFLVRPAPPRQSLPPGPAATPVAVDPTVEPAGRTLFAPGSKVGSGDAPAPAVASGVITNWEEKVDDVLRDPAETDMDAKAKKLLDLFPTLPPDGQAEAAKHIANLTSDTNYFGIGSYLTNAATAPEVLEEWFADLLNRPNSVKLPTLLDIARNPDHPNAAEAKDILELFLEEDYGSDWAKWQQSLAAWLKENED